MDSKHLHERVVYYDKAEELANCLTHGVGALLSLIGAGVLIWLAAEQGDFLRLLSVCIYGGAMVTFYCMSTAYHSVKRPYMRYVFRILDHASIFLMIAGSYTPFAMVTLRGTWGWWLLGTVWGLGAVGILLKIFMTHRLRIMGPILYLLVGWVAVVAIKPLSAALAAEGLALLFGGGIAYTVGVIFYAWDRIPFNHAIWHVFVMVGSACHFAAIFLYVTPMQL